MHTYINTYINTYIYTYIHRVERYVMINMNAALANTRTLLCLNNIVGHFTPFFQIARIWVHALWLISQLYSLCLKWLKSNNGGKYKKKYQLEKIMTLYFEDVCCGLIKEIFPTLFWRYWTSRYKASSRYMVHRPDYFL